jgi:hypothetical protein
MWAADSAGLIAPPIRPVASKSPTICVLLLLNMQNSPLGYRGLHWMEHAEAGAGAMLVACRLAGLSALEAYHGGVRVGAQCGPRGLKLAMAETLSVEQSRQSPEIAGVVRRQRERFPYFFPLPGPDGVRQLTFSKNVYTAPMLVDGRSLH